MSYSRLCRASWPALSPFSLTSISSRTVAASALGVLHLADKIQPRAVRAAAAGQFDVAAEDSCRQFRGPSPALSAPPSPTSISARRTFFRHPHLANPRPAKPPIARPRRHCRRWRTGIPPAALIGRLRSGHGFHSVQDGQVHRPRSRQIGDKHTGKHFPPRNSTHFPSGPGRCWGIAASIPSATFTGLDTSLTCPDFKPDRLAVTVMVPGVSVERKKTRLIPSSVFR